MNTLKLNLSEILLEKIRTKSRELKPHLSDEEALESFIQVLFIRFYMDLQPHDLTFAAIAGDSSSNLQPFRLQLSLSEMEDFSKILQFLNVSGYENMLNLLRKRLFQHFSAIDPLISAKASISFGLL